MPLIVCYKDLRTNHVSVCSKRDYKEIMQYEDRTRFPILDERMCITKKKELKFEQQMKKKYKS